MSVSSILPKYAELVYRNGGRIVFEPAPSGEIQTRPKHVAWFYIFEDEEVLAEVLASKDKHLAPIQAHIRMCQSFNSPLVSTVDEILDLMELVGIVQRSFYGSPYSRLTGSYVKLYNEHGLIFNTLFPDGLAFRQCDPCDHALMFNVMRSLAFHQQALKALKREPNTLPSRTQEMNYDNVWRVNRRSKQPDFFSVIVPRNMRRRPIARNHLDSWKRSSQPYTAQVYEMEVPVVDLGFRKPMKNIIRRLVPLDVAAAVS